MSCQNKSSRTFSTAIWSSSIKLGKKKSVFIKSMNQERKKKNKEMYAVLNFYAIKTNMIIK